MSEATAARAVRGAVVEALPRVSTLVVGLVVVAAVVGWALVPAEWSFVDDAGLKTSLLAAVHQHGVVGGVVSQISAMVRTDRTWGLFRPLYWVYGGTFYLLGPAEAHATRMLMLAVTIAIPPLLVFRRSQHVGRRSWWLAAWAALVVAANPTLYEGLTLNSLQELSGLFLVALGLGDRRPWLRTVLWLGAAWFKAPFAWLLAGWGLVSLRRRDDRVRGTVALVAAVGTLLAAAYFSRHGTYTRAFSLHAATLRQSVSDLISAVKVPGAVAVLGMVALGISPLRLLPRDGTAAALALGGLGYAANMLPWRLNSYYPSPVIWLLSVAALLAVASSEPARRRRTDRWRAGLAVAGTSAAAIVALHSVARTVAGEYDRGASLKGLVSWARSLAPASREIGVNAEEASVRLPELVLLADPTWHGSVRFVPPGESIGPALDYYVLLPDQGGGSAPYERHILRRWQHAVIYATRP